MNIIRDILTAIGAIGAATIFIALILSTTSKQEAAALPEKQPTILTDIVLVDILSPDSQDEEMPPTEANLREIAALAENDVLVRSFMTHNDECLGREIGYFYNFRTRGGELLGDFKFLDSFRTTRHDEYLVLVELIELELAEVSVVFDDIGEKRMEIGYIYSFDWVTDGDYVGGHRAEQ